MTQECDKETRIAIVEHDMSEIKADIKTILEAVMGNGKPGLRTQVDRLEQAQARIWWAVSGVGASVTGIAGYILKCFMGG